MKKFNRSAKLYSVVFAILICFSVCLGSLYVNAQIWTSHAEDFGYPSLSNTYNITTAGQFAEIARLVNDQGIDMGGQVFSINNDIDLSAYKWIPIGTKDRPFKGVIRGVGENGVTISGINIDGSFVDYGLVGYMENATVVKLTLNGSIQAGSNAYVGSAAGRAINDCAVASITNNITINVNGGNAYVGGIVAIADGSVGNIKNNGSIKVEADNAYVGGIVGSAQEDSSLELKLSDAINNGTITTKISNESYIGGILSSSKNVARLTIAAESSENPMQNNAAITHNGGNTRIAGIVGYINETTDLTLPKNVKNKGNITVENVKTSKVGSFIGEIAQNLNFDINYTNSGEIRISSGVVEGEVYTGGLLGRINGYLKIDTPFENASLINVEVNGNDSSTGGLLGKAYGDIVLNGKVSCSNSNITVNAPNSNNAVVGGIGAHITGDITINDTIIESKSPIHVIANENAYTGGLFGKIDGSINNNSLNNMLCEADIDVTAKSGAETGGFIGVISGKAVSLSNLTYQNSINIDVENESSLSANGGIVGYIGGEGKLTGISFKGSIVDTSAVLTHTAGIVGYVEKNNVTLENIAVGNLKDTTANVFGGGYVGGVSSYFNGKLYNSKVEYLTLKSISGSGYVGGIFGYSTKDAIVGTEAKPIEISNAKIEANNATTNEIGGAIGKNETLGLYLSTQDVNILVSDTNNTNVGGVLASNIVALSEKNLTNNQNLTLEISGQNTNAGGVIGYNTNNISKVYAKNINITSSGQSQMIGGVIGENKKTASALLSELKLENLVLNSKATNSLVGGIVGYTDDNIAVSRLTAEEYSYITVEGENSKVGGFAGETISCDVTGTPITGQDRIENIEKCIITVKNTALNSVIGGVIGNNDSSAISDFFGNSVIIKNNASNSIIGGFVGLNKGMASKDIMGSSIHSISISLLEGADHNILGGIVGKNLARDGEIDDYEKNNAISSISNTHLKGNIDVYSNENMIGGGVGENNSVLTNFSITDNVTLNVFGQNNTIGGLIGKNNKYVWFVYSNAALSVNSVNSVVGGLVGENTNDVYASYIDNNISTTLTGNSSQYVYSGGLVGKNSGTVDNSYVGANIVGGGSYHCVGGLVGLNTGKILNSYTTGSVKADGANNFAGGFAGRITQGNITNSYSSALMYRENSGNKGGFIGRYDNPNKNLLSRCYYLKDESVGMNNGVLDFADVTNAELLNPPALNSITKTQLNGEEYFKNLSGWDFATIWKYGSSNGQYLYPELIIMSTTSESTANYNINWYTKSMNSPIYQIKTAAELAGLAKLVNGNVSGYSAFDFKGRIIEITDKINLQSAQWEPIGIEGKEFNGTIDSKGNLISGLRVSPMTNAGLFGVLGKDGMIKNFYVEPVSVRVNQNQIAGVLVSYNKGVVENSIVALKKQASITGGSMIGGLIGKNDGSATDCKITIDESSSLKATIDGTIIGGAIGENNTSNVSNITVALSDGLISASVNNAVVGGVIGRQNSDSSNLSFELNRNGQLSLQGNNGMIGGVIGHYTKGNGDHIKVTILNGDFSASGNDNIVGGVIGLSDKENLLQAIEITSNRSEADFTSDISSNGGILGGVIGKKLGKLTSGIFDLDNLKISNVCLNFANNASNGYVGGVIGYSDKAIIKNTVSSAVVNATGKPSIVGGILGCGENTVIYKAMVTPDINVNITDYSTDEDVNVGGIAGEMKTTENYNTAYQTGVMQGAYKGVNDSIVNSGKINATGNTLGEQHTANIGGAVGLLVSSSIYFVDAKPELAIDGFKKINAGGIIGAVIGNSNYLVNNDVIVKVNAKNTQYYNVGGFAGEVWGSVVAYNKVLKDSDIIISTALGTAPKTNVGGFIGELKDSDVSYSTANADVLVECDNQYNIVYTGGFVGTVDKDVVDTVVRKCYSNSKLNVNTEKDSFAGGFVGFLDDATISESYATGNISNEAYNARSGGFVGSTSPKSRIEYAYAVDNEISAGRDGVNPASSAYAGGFAGYNNGTLSEVYANPSLVKARAQSSSADYTGALVGYNYDIGKIEKSYYDYSDKSVFGFERNNNPNQNDVCVNKALLTDRNAIDTIWDFATNGAKWTYVDLVNKERPVLTNVDNHVMDTNADFLKLLPYNNTEYTVTNNRELALVERLYNSDEFKALYNRTTTAFPTPTKVTLSEDIDLTAKTWEPIQNFTGIFEGNNKVIQGLYRYAPSYNGFGLVHNNNDLIQNIIFENADLNIGDHSGIVSGTNHKNIFNVSIKASEVNATNDNVGVISGVNETNGTISNITVNKLNKALTGNDYIGGVCGKSLGKCSNVTLEDIVIEGNHYVGAVCGLGNLIDTVTTNEVTITANRLAGGIAGEVTGDIKAVTANGKITVTGTDTHIGGVVGKTSGNVTVTKLSDVAVSSKADYISGVVGEMTAAKAIVVNTANDITVNGANYVGGVAGKTVGEITNATVNTVTITANKLAGGIAGEVTGDIKAVTANGKITVTGTDAHIGGVVGKTSGNVTVTKLSDVAVSSKGNYISGIVGEMTAAKAIVVNTVNDITVNGANYVGGVAGKTVGEITNATVNTVTITANKLAGGIVGEVTGDIKAVTANGKITVTGTDTHIGGVVGKTSGNVTVTKLSDVAVSSKGDYISGVVGEMTAAKAIVVNTANDITVNGANYVGGVAGKTVGEITIATVNSVTVTANKLAGGIAGEVTGDIKAVTANGKITVTGTDTHIGGVVGKTSGNVTVTKLSDVAVSSKADYISGIVGEMTAVKAIAVNTANDITVNGVNYVGGMAGKTVGDITKVSCNNLSVTGTDNVAGIAPIAKNISNVSVNKLIVNGQTNTSGVTIEIASGSIVNNIKINENVDITATNDKTAVISAVNNGTIENVTVENATVTGVDNVGGCTSVNSGVIRNASIKAKIPVSETYVGGVAAKNLEGAIIENSNFSGEITGRADNAGGIAGYNNGTVRTSYSGGKLNVTDLSNAMLVGGIVGFNDIRGNISECFTMADCMAEGYEVRVGGIAGETTGRVKNCYTASAIQISGEGKRLAHVGGIVGYLTNGIVQNCINTAQIKVSSSGKFVENKTFFGGILGKKSNETNTIVSNNIFDTKLTGANIAYYNLSNIPVKTDIGKCDGVITDTLITDTLPQGFDNVVWASDEKLLPKLICFDNGYKEVSIISRAIPVFKTNIHNIKDEFVLNTDNDVVWSGDNDKINIAGAKGKLLVSTPVEVKIASGGKERTVVLNSKGILYPQTAVKPEGLKNTTFNDNIIIELSTSEENGKIYYTLDGTIPTEFSILYSQPITLKETTLINAITVCDNKNGSEVTEATYTKQSNTPSGGGGGGGGSVTTYYTIAVTQGSGGKINSEDVKVAKNESKKITITANDGYEIADVLVDGNSVGAVSEYTFEKITANAKITAEFKKIDLTQPTEWKNSFNDVLENDWFFSAVKFINENGLMSGTSKTTFSPNDETTRAMLVTILYRMENEPNSDLSSFEDVKYDDYFVKAVAWAKENDIVSGKSETQFAPNENITREQMVKILYKYANNKGYDTNKTGELSSFSDASAVSDYAKEAVSWAIGRGLLKGKDTNRIYPQGNAARVEIAVILQRFIENIAK